MDHHRIDSGESSPLKNMTPVLVPNGTVPYDKLVRQFTERAVDTDRELYALVLRKLSVSRGEVDAGSFSDRGLYLVTRRQTCLHGNTPDPIKT